MKNRVFSTLLLGAALSILTVFPAVAAPSIFGPTGLIDTPTADTIPNGGFNVGFHRVNSLNVATFNLSLMDNLEVGATIFPGDSRDVDVNAKFRLINESASRPAVAIGVQDFASDYNRSVYGVLTKNIHELGIRGSIGLDSEAGLIAGLSKELNPVSITKSGRGGSSVSSVFLLDYDGYGLNVGLGLRFTPELRANIYLMDMHDAALGLSYQAKF